MPHSFTLPEVNIKVKFSAQDYEPFRNEEIYDNLSFFNSSDQVLERKSIFVVFG